MKKGTIRISTLFRWWLILYALLETSVITGLGISGNLVVLFAYFTPIAMFIIYVAYGLSSRIFGNIRFIRKWVLLFFVFLALEYVYTCRMYNLSLLGNLWETFRHYHYWTKLLLIFPIVYVFEYDGTIDRLMNSFIYTAVAGNIMRCAAWIGKSFADISVFPVLADTITGTRGGRLRYGASKMHTLAFDVSLTRSFEYNNRRIKWILFAIFMSIYQFYIANGRSQSLCYLISILVCIYFSTQWSKSNESRYKLLFIILSILGLAALVYNGFFSAIYESFFSTTSAEYGSTQNRLYAIAYYNRVIKDKWFFGMGLLYDDSSSGGMLYYILRNPGNGGNIAFYEDLGLLGQFYNYGAVGSIFFVSVIVRMFKIARRALKQKSHYGPMLMTLFTHFITMTLTSMSMFISLNSLQLAIEIALFEYVNSYLDGEGEEERECYIQ